MGVNDLSKRGLRHQPDAFSTSSFAMFRASAQFPLFHRSIIPILHEMLLFFLAVLWCLPANGAGDFTFTSVPAYPATITVNGIVYDSESAQQAWSIQKATNASTSVYRFEVRDGDLWSSATGGDNSERSEFDGYRTMFAKDTTVYLSYALWVEPGASFSSSWNILGQMHNQTGFISFYIYLKNEKFEIHTETSTGTDPNNGNNRVGTTRYTSPTITRGAWYDFFYEMRRSSSGTSDVFKAYVNGTKQSDVSGAIFFPTGTQGAYWKFGIYRGNPGSGIPTQAVRWCNVEATTSDITSRITNPLPHAIPLLVADPTFSPAAGTYSSAQSVTISTTNSGAAIRYTTDGSTPSASVGTVYSAPVNISATTTLKAIAYKSGMADSAVATAVYTINTAHLLFSDEFDTFNFASATNANGFWRPNDFWQSISSGGYKDFAGTSWNINPNNPTFAPYNPFSVSNSILTITCTRTPTALVSAIQAEMTAQGIPGAVPAWCGGMLIQNPAVRKFKYGYFEFRARWPNPGKGMFPALWFYSTDGGADPQGKSWSEIDLLEIFGVSNTWSTSLHGGTGYTIGTKTQDTTDWHTYALDWQPTYLKVYRDDVLVYTVTGADAEWFNATMGIRLNYAMDASWFGANTSDSNTPDNLTMQVDYVRVYDHDQRDTVGDGIPDWWRAQYFGGAGTTTNASSCATGDADGTGQNNRFKYITGLDPTNPASIFSWKIAPVPGQLNRQNLIYNPTASGRLYAVEFSTNLVRMAFTNLTNLTAPQSNGSQVTITDTNAVAPVRFYRLRISLP
jgi:hypothetical protein